MLLLLLLINVHIISKYQKNGLIFAPVDQLQKYKELQKEQTSSAGHVKELEKKYSSALHRVQELEA